MAKEMQDGIGNHLPKAPHLQRQPDSTSSEVLCHVSVLPIHINLNLYGQKTLSSATPSAFS